MKKIKGLVCSKCGKMVDETVMYNCPDCGTEGTLDVIYDMDLVKKELTKEYLLNNDDKNIWDICLSFR